MTQALVVNRKSQAILTRVRSIADLSELTAPTRTIRRAIAHWKASEYDDTQLLKDLSGNGLDAQLGSTAGVDTADPKHLPYKPWGVNPDGSVNVGSAAGNYVTLPSAPVSFTTTFDIAVKIAFADWSATGTYQGVVNKIGGDSGYAFLVDPNGFPYVQVKNVSTREYQGTAGLGLADGAAKWVRATFVADRGDGFSEVVFYTSDDGVVWTQSGAVRTAASGPIKTNTAVPQLSWWGGNNSARLYRAVFKSSINGPIVADFDASKIKSGPFYNDGLGNNWYGLGSAAWGDHFTASSTNSNFSSAPATATTDLTGSLDLRALLVPESGPPYGIIIARDDGSGQRSWNWDLQSGQDLRFHWYTAGALQGLAVASGVVTVGTPTWIRCLFDNKGGGAFEVKFFKSVDGVTWTQIGSTASFSGKSSPTSFPNLPTYIGGRPMTTTADPFKGRIYRAQVFASIDGTDKRADVRFDKPLKWNNGQHTDPQGNVWTINRSALQSRLKVVANSHVELYENTGDDISTPDAAEIDSITGDFDLRARIAPTTWAPAGPTYALVGKYSSSGNANRSFLFVLENTGFLRLYLGDGTTTYNSQSSLRANTVFSDGSTGWLRATWRQSDGRVQFFTSTDGATWTQLGPDAFIGAGVTIANSNQPLEVGSWASAYQFSGKFYEAQVWKGIPGVSASARLVANPKFTALTSYAPYKEPSYLALPGVAGAFASSPDHVDLGVTGDIDLRWYGAIDKSVPGVFQALVAKEDGTNAGYLLTITSGGFLRFTWGSGAARFDKDSTVAHAVPDGASKWMRATLDVDNGAGGSDLKFWLSDDGSAWTQLGATVTTAGVTSIATNVKALWIGSRDVTASTLPFTGRTFRAIVKNGIDGTTVFDADFTNLLDGQASFVEVTGKTVTVNGTARIERRTWTFTRAALSPRAELRTGRYAYFPGANSNSLTSPANPAYNVGTDFQFTMDWTPENTGQQQAFGYANPTSTIEGGWMVYAYPTSLTFYVGSGSGETASMSLAGIDWRFGERALFRFSYTLVTRLLVVERSVNGGVSWSTLASGSHTGSVMPAITGATNRSLVIGVVPYSTSNPMLGGLRAATYVVDGATVAAFDLADAMLMPTEPHNGFTDLYGNAWTVNRATGQAYKTALVDRPLFLFDGVNDYMDIFDKDILDMKASDSFTLLGIYRVHSGGSTFLSKKGSSTAFLAGWRLNAEGGFSVADGVVAPATGSSGSNPGITKAIAGVRDVSIDKLKMVVNGVEVPGTQVTDTTTGTLENAQSARIGRLHDGGQYSAMEFMGAAIFKEALTDAQIAEVINEFAYDPELVGVL